MSRRKPPRRPRRPHPATGERHYDGDESEFLAAVLAWRAANGWRVPTNCQLLAIHHNRLPLRHVIAVH